MTTNLTLDLSSIRSTLTRSQHTLNPHFSTSSRCTDIVTTRPARRLSPQKSAHIPTRPQIRSSKTESIRHPWSPYVPSPLRRDSSGSSPYPPFSPQTACVAALPNCLHNPLLCALAFTGHFCRWIHPPGRRPRFEATSPALFADPSGTSTQRFGVRTA